MGFPWDFHGFLIAMFEQRKVSLRPGWFPVENSMETLEVEPGKAKTHGGKFSNIEVRFLVGTWMVGSMALG